MKRFIIILFIMFSSSLFAGNKWFELYEKGLRLESTGKWEEAIYFFKKALAIKSKDAGRIRTYGTHFIDYFPHREIGVCYYFLKKYHEAMRELKISIAQKASKRAVEYLSSALRAAGVKPQKQTPVKQEEKYSAKEEVTENLKVAVLPFRTKGLNRDIGDIILDKMITSLVNMGRFEVMERAELDKVLKEQNLELSGVVDAATAARVGKGIGLDAIIVGSVSSTGSGISLDARLIDTETASIITSKDAYIYRTDIGSVKSMVDNIAKQIVNDVPILHGFVVQVEDSTVYIDIGSEKGIKRGLKMVIYREGNEIKNPLSGEVLGRKIVQVCEAVVSSVQRKMASCHIIKFYSDEVPQVGDKVITK